MFFLSKKAFLIPPRVTRKLFPIFVTFRLNRFIQR